MMNCIIIDDDKVAQKAIEFLINKTNSLCLIGTFENPNKALEILTTEKIDLIFLDIEMPEISGIDFLKNFGDLPQIIVCSSKKEYAVDAFEYNVTDYLVKPINYERFTKALNRVKEEQESFKNNTEDTFFIKNKGTYVNVSAKEIIYFEALSDYVCVYTKTNRYIISSTMRAIESKLLKKEFIRVHRSFIIRIDKIKTIEDGFVLLGDKSIPVSKSHKKELLNQLNFL